MSTSYVAPSATTVPPLSTTERGHSSSAYGRSGHHQHRDVERAQDVGELASRGGPRLTTARRGPGSGPSRARSRRRPAGAGRRRGGGRAVDVPAMPTWSSAAITRRSSSAPARPRLAGPKATPATHGPLGEELVVRVPEHDTDATADLAQVGLSTGRPLTATGARLEDAVQVQHQGRFAGAVGPQEGDPPATVDVAGRRPRTGPGGRRGRRRRGPARRGDGDASPRHPPVYPATASRGWTAPRS